MQNDPDNELPDVADDDGLTAAERAELDADTSSNGAPTTESGAEAAPAPTPEPTPEPEPSPEPTPDPTAVALSQLAASQERTAATLDAVTQRMAPTPSDTPPTPEAPKEPDWDAERKALKAKYDDGDLEDDQYEQEREALLERKTEWRAENRAAKIVEERLQQDEEARQKQRQADLDQQWEASLGAFMAVATNATLLSDNTRAAAFNAVLAEVARENPTQGYDKMLAEARDRTLRAFNLVDPAAADAEAVRKQKLAEELRKRGGQPAPPDLSRVPQAGVDVPRSDEFSDLDGLDADALENTLARMKPEDVERYLESAPGGLLDNPRGA